MDCREATTLLSPYLDGQLTAEDAGDLERHLENCPPCRGELALYRRISGVFKTAGWKEIQAPPELCNQVMARVRGNRRGVLHRLPGAWRRAVAAAAAVLILAGGSYGVTAGMKIAGRDVNLVGFALKAGPQGGADMVTGPSARPETDNPVVGPGPVLNPTPSGTDAPVSNPPDVGKTVPEAPPAGQTSPGNDGGDDFRVSGTEAGPAEGPTALLSGVVKVNSINLKLSVSDLEAARAKVLAMTLPSGDGATAQVFPGQVEGKQVLVMRLLVAPEEAEGLISKLSALGSVLERQDESRDLTALYNETQAQYNDLLGRRTTAMDSVERQQLEYRAAGLKQQLDSWDAEAGRQVIVLWLEDGAGL